MKSTHLIPLLKIEESRQRAHSQKLRETFWSDLGFSEKIWSRVLFIISCSLSGYRAKNQSIWSCFYLPHSILFCCFASWRRGISHFGLNLSDRNALLEAMLTLFFFILIFTDVIFRVCWHFSCVVTSVFHDSHHCGRSAYSTVSFGLCCANFGTQWKCESLISFFFFGFSSSANHVCVSY